MLGRLLVPAGLDGLVAHVATHGRRVLQLLLRDLLECLVDVLDCALGRLVARVEGVAYHLQSIGIHWRCWDGYLALQRHLGGALAGGSRASPRPLEQVVGHGCTSSPIEFLSTYVSSSLK